MCPDCWVQNEPWKRGLRDNVNPVAHLGLRCKIRDSEHPIGLENVFGKLRHDLELGSRPFAPAAAALRHRVVTLRHPP